MQLPGSRSHSRKGENAGPGCHSLNCARVYARFLPAKANGVHPKICTGAVQERRAGINGLKSHAGVRILVGPQRRPPRGSSVPHRAAPLEKIIVGISYKVLGLIPGIIRPFVTKSPAPT